MVVDGQRRDLVNPNANPAVYTWPSFGPRVPGFQDFVLLYRLIRKYRPNCMIAEFSSVRLMSLLGWLTGVRQRVVWYHTLTSQIEMDVQMSSIRWRLNRIVRRAVHQLATQIIAVSEAAKLEAQSSLRIPPERCRVFYNSLFDPLSREAIAPLGVRQRRILCVGRFFPSKGQEILIRALAYLKDLPDFEVVFVGEGPQKQACQDLALELDVAERCRFSGYLPHSDLMQLLAESSFAVAPSLDEAFGYMLIESMSVGTPVVATRVGGIPEIVRDGLDGFLIAPNDPQMLAEKMRKLLEAPDLREKMGRLGRQRILDRFNSAKLIPQQVEWIEHLCRQT